MITLLSSLLGFVGAAFPDFLKLFRDKADRIDELAILDKQITDLQTHVNTRLGNRSFTLDVPFEARQFLLRNGTSAEYGARELNRTTQITSNASTKIVIAMIR